MQKITLLLFLFSFAEKGNAQFVYRGKVYSEIRQTPIGFGTVRTPSPQGGMRTGRRGKELAQIDSLGFFTVTLHDTANAWLIIDCMFAGSTKQRVFYTDSIILFPITTSCYEYNAEKARKDIENNRMLLLCDLNHYDQFSAKDSIFESKYGVKYHSFGDQPIMFDCKWLYNKTIAEYLDKKFGQIWRAEARWQVRGY